MLKIPGIVYENTFRHVQFFFHIVVSCMSEYYLPMLFINKITPLIEYVQIYLSNID